MLLWSSNESPTLTLIQIQHAQDVPLRDVEKLTKKIAYLQALVAGLPAIHPHNDSDDSATESDARRTHRRKRTLTPESSDGGCDHSADEPARRAPSRRIYPRRNFSAALSASLNRELMIQEGENGGQGLEEHHRLDLHHLLTVSIFISSRLSRR
jgi:hypothetical protein